MTEQQTNTVDNCPTCGENFDNKTSLTIHHSKAHGEWIYNVDWLSIEEKRQLADLAERLQNQSVFETFKCNISDWNIFKRVVRYSQPNNSAKLPRYIPSERVKRAFNSTEQSYDYNNHTIISLGRLFHIVEDCEDKDASVQKEGRTTMRLGRFIAEYGCRPVYMAASISPNYKDYYTVVKNTSPDARVVKVSGRNRYKLYERYGFKKLKSVPLVDSTDHNYCVPGYIHRNHRQ